MDRNQRRHRLMKITAMTSIPVLSFVVLLTMFSLQDGFSLGTLGAAAVTTLLACLLPFVLTMPFTVPYLGSSVTPTIPDHMDRASLKRAISGLAQATRQGLPADRRMSLLHDLQASSALLEHLCGRPPWVEAAEDESKPDTSHLALRGERLKEHGATLCRMVDARHGHEREEFGGQVALVVPLIASIARDFGLDPADFAPTERPVAGQIRGESTPVPQLAAPTVALADEWLSGSRGRVPELLATAADSAARQDLDELQRSWKAARASAPDDAAAERVDETFGTALSDISRTLSEAIAARSSGDETNLHIQVRYIESKHGSPAALTAE